MTSTAVTLYVVRHAIAAERGEQYPDDTKRPLTPRGMTRFRQAVKGLTALGVTLDQILTSPLVRARQTADIMAEEFPGRPPVVETRALAPGASFESLIDALAEYARYREIALVGHEPGIGGVAARLVAAQRPFDFKKGAICRIDVDALPPAAPGQLRWFVTPKILRMLSD